MAKDTRKRLLDAVEVVLDAEGVSGLSLRKVAALAGVSHAAPGVVFGDRAGLLTAYACEGFRRLAVRMAREDGVDGPDQLAAVGRSYAAFALADPNRFEIMCRQDMLDGEDLELKAAAAAAYQPLRRVIRRCVDEGFVEAKDARSTALVAWSLVHGLVLLWSGHHLQRRIPDADPTELADVVTARLAALLRQKA